MGQTYKKFRICGAILGCLDEAVDKAIFQVTEMLVDDPWLAIVETKGALTFEEVRGIHAAYQLDPDKSKIPYYFIIEEVGNKNRMVWFSDEIAPTPINTNPEKETAAKLGMNKGILESLRWLGTKEAVNLMVVEEAN